MKKIDINQFKKHLTKTTSSKTGKNLMPKTQYLYIRWFEYHNHQRVFDGSIDEIIAKMNKVIYERKNIVEQAMFLQVIECMSENQEEEILYKNKINKITKRKKTSTVDKALMDNNIIIADSMNDFIKQASTTRLQLAIKMLFDTACRRSELLSIKVGDIKFVEKVKHNVGASINVLGKRGLRRTVYLSKQTAKDAKKFIEKYKLKDDDFVIHYPNIKDQQQKLWRQITAIGRQLFEESVVVTPHKFRHAAAITMGRRGLDIKDIKEYLGHSSIATAEIYARYEESRKEQTAEKFFERN